MVVNLKFKVDITNLAKQDISDIYNYVSVSLLSPSTAKKQIDNIIKAAKSLKVFPERYALSVFPELLEKEIRLLPVNNYVVFYRINMEQRTIYIERILYNKRNFGDFL